MFAKNKVSQSMLDAVNEVLTKNLDEASLKIDTPTGTKVLGGSGYGSKKAHEVQHKNPFEKGPSKAQLKGIKAPTKKELKSIGEEEVQEELKGNQSKIDANHNGKIDRQDFKILRGKKKVKEDTFAGKLLNSLSESEEIRKAINEVMKKDATAGDWIHDFVHSKNPKFAGKSTKERQKMALGAYYAKQNEETEDYEINKNTSEPEDTPARKSIKAKSTEKSQKIDNLDVKYGTPNSFKCEEVEETEALVENFNIINEVSVGAKIRAYANHARDAWEHGDMGNDDESEHHSNRAEKIMAHIEKHHGPEAAKHADKLANSMTFGRHNIGSKTSPGKDSLSDGLRRSSDTPSLTKSGKIPKGTQKSMRNPMWKRKITGPKGHLPEEVELDEAAPKKMDDVMRGKQNLEPAKKGVVGTVKSDLKNFGRFLAGKKETNEAINASNQTIDTLAGRSKKVPKEAKIDNAHSSAKVELKAEEVESLEEDRYLEKFLSSRGINPKFVDRNVKVAHAKSNVYKSWLKNHKDMMRTENNEVPFDKPYKTIKEPVVTDKSGAKHTPMSRARDLARQALKKVKNETMMGTAGATSESKK